jgi:hypothetical protein
MYEFEICIYTKIKEGCYLGNLGMDPKVIIK